MTNSRFKFRVWDNHQKEMLTAPLADLDSIFICMFDGEIYLDRGRLKKAEEGIFEIMQSTGLYDCEGREIWEGDVLQHKIESDFRLLVEYRRGAYRIIDAGPTSHNGCEEGLLSEVDGTCFMYQVIGNRFENSELLEGK